MILQLLRDNLTVSHPWIASASHLQTKNTVSKFHKHNTVQSLSCFLIVHWIWWILVFIILLDNNTFMGDYFLIFTLVDFATYIFLPHDLIESPWYFDEFMHIYLQHFVKRCATGSDIPPCFLFLCFLTGNGEFISIYLKGFNLRLPHRNDAKIAKIHKLWTFWPVIRPIHHLFKIWRKAFLPNAP